MHDILIKLIKSEQFSNIYQPSMQSEILDRYRPLKWPPNLELARAHMRCSCPGRDNLQGFQCPCCGRYEKLKIRQWKGRDILKDFKSYGGGIPAYFQLLKYCGISLICLAIIVTLYHMYILSSVCNSQPSQCQSFLNIFKFCTFQTVDAILKSQKRYLQAAFLFYLQMASFIYLIVATIGMKLWLQKINVRQIVKQDKVYSNFSLLIKNIPKFYSLPQIQEDIVKKVGTIQIRELFFVFEVAELDTKFKELFDLKYKIDYIQEAIDQKRGESQKTLQKEIKKYIKLYEQVQELKRKIGQNNGRAIIVLNNVEDRDKIKQAFKMPFYNKLILQTLLVFGQNTEDMNIIAYKIPQPQQVIWKNVGQSSATKTKVKIQTTILGLGFIGLAFALLYVPIIELDSTKAKSTSTLTSVLSLVVSILLQFLSILYRQIIMRLINRRRPSTKNSESLFLVITTVTFHFFFYLVAPISYYMINFEDILPTQKLKQLFITVLTSLVLTVFIALVDTRHLIYKSRRKKILSKWGFWGKFCQLRLHQQLKWPSFPIQFKLMVMMNIWSFNAFYVFQVPYLLFTFVVTFMALFWIDKRNMYRHYKMQTYQSIQLQISAQKTYIIMFLLCLCTGYGLCAIYTWQYFFAIGMFILSIIVNFLVTYNAKTIQKKQQMKRTMTLGEVVQTQSANPKQSMLHSLIETQMRQNLTLVEMESEVSVGSAIFQFGYKQMYQVYLSQFKNRTVVSLLKRMYKRYKNGGETELNDTRKQIRVSRILKQEGALSKIDDVSESSKSSRMEQNLVILNELLEIKDQLVKQQQKMKQQNKQQLASEVNQQQQREQPTPNEPKQQNND